MIKNLIFDFGGVLSVSGHNVAVQRFKDLGVPDTDKIFVEGKNWSGIFGQVEEGTIKIEDFLKEVSALCKRDITFEDIAYAWWGFHLRETKGLFKEIDTWRNEGYKIFMLSNNNPFMMSYIRSEKFAPEGKPFYSYFDKIYVSCEIGLAKPDEPIYRYVIDDANIKPEESIFVDDREQNLVNAEKIGMHTFFVNEIDTWIPKFKETLKK